MVARLKLLENTRFSAMAPKRLQGKRYPGHLSPGLIEADPARWQIEKRAS